MSRALAPRTARHARLLRLANKLQRDNVPGAPKSEADKLVWVNSHISKDNDIRLSQEEESIRLQRLPTAVTGTNFITHRSESKGEMFQFREFPMFPGEYVPPEHNTLQSLRDELKMDLTVQNLRDAWMRISGGQFFSTMEEYYLQTTGMDESHLGEIVSALYPSLSEAEASALVRRVLESLSHPTNSARRRVAQTVTAEALGLDKSPGHYTNFLEWLGRLTETKAFKTEQCIDEFCRRRFNRDDVRIMNQNYLLMSTDTLKRESADTYSHFFSVLKDFATKVASVDSRHQIGVRIDPPEIDAVTGCSFGFGKREDISVVCILRENRDKSGIITAQGKPLGKYFRDEAWHMELVLQPFDEAGLDYRDFDAALLVEGQVNPEPNLDYIGNAARMAVANAISKMIPVTRIPLRKSGLLSMDRRRELGEHPGYRDGKNIRRPFSKR